MRKSLGRSEEEPPGRPTPEANTFGPLLKFWRTAFKLSQEDLSDRIDVSPRHISFLENGRTVASRALIETLAASLGLGKRDAGNLLLAAGYLPRSQVSDLHEPGNEFLRRGLAATVTALEPFAAAVIDPCGNVKMVNRAWVHFHKQAFGPSVMGGEVNTIRLLVAEDGWRRYVEDWSSAACLYLVILQQEAIMRGDAQAAAMIREITALPGVPKDWARRGAGAVSDGHNHITRVRSPKGVPRRFINIHHTVGSTAFVSEPRLIIQILYPEDGRPELTVDQLKGCSDLHHPLLAQDV